jgi:gliding motility-associated-like protein
MISLNEYSVSIFNRHGELIFYTEDVNQSWDGSISGSPNTSMGVYIYQVEFKNSEGRYFLKKGHINLIP